MSVSSFDQPTAEPRSTVLHGLGDPSKQGHGQFRRNPMNYAEPRSRVYDPAAFAMMGRAFDKAVKGLSPEAKADPIIRRNLARCMLRVFDEGETARLYT